MVDVIITIKAEGTLWVKRNLTYVLCMFGRLASIVRIAFFSQVAQLQEEKGDNFIVSISWWILLKYLTSSTYVPTISVSIINKQENTRKSNICYQASYKYSHEWHPIQERPSIKMLKGDCCSESKYQYTLPKTS